MGARMIIRPATPSDAEPIWAILEPVFRAGETYCVPTDISRAAALDYWWGGAHACFVAEARGQIGSYEGTDEDGKAAALWGAYFLTPNQRGNGAHVCNCGFVTGADAAGKGVARAMLDHALDEARQAGFRAMQFNFVVATNVRAIAIWERTGFDVVGRLPGAFRHPREGYVDALVMYRNL